MAASPDTGPDCDGGGRQESELLSFVTHEIGNQLTVIGGFAEMLADGVDDLPPEIVREFSQAILRGAEQMRALLQSVSDLRRIDSGRLEVHPEVVDLVPCVRRVVGLARLHLGARRIELVMPDAFVTTADPHRVQQILGNLLSNAAKFTPPTASVTVELSAVELDLELSVTDDGPGVRGEDPETLFGRFSRPGTSGKGMGIGLYVSREVARAHGGDLLLVEQPMGARFVLRLPHRPG